jgi:hypothetical protein
MYYLGYYYQFTEKDYELMKKYYFMAIELKHSLAMYYLGYYYQFTEKDYELMKKYYFMAIELKHSLAMYNLKNSINKWELYNTLYEIENKNELITNTIVELENNIKIIKCKEKINDKNIIPKECIVCYENKMNINLDNCMHELCLSCYCNIRNCPLCRK